MLVGNESFVPYMVPRVAFMKNMYNYVLTLLLVIFFCHGVLYFWDTSSYYSYQNPIKIIKYILMLLFMILLFFVKKKIVYQDLIAIALVFFMVTNALVSHAVFDDYIMLINYCVPICTLSLYPIISKKCNVYSILVITYVFSSIIAYIEFWWLNGVFDMFSDMGYRVCSVFINPNNYGTYIWIVTSMILIKEDNSLVKTITLGNSLFLLILTGSRSSLIIMYLIVVMVLFYNIAKTLSSKYKLSQKNIAMLLVCFLIILLLAVSDLSINNFFDNGKGIRNITDIDLTVGRYEQYLRFFDRSDFNIFYPNMYSDVYVDNLFLHVWSFFGLPTACLYIGGSIFIIYRLWHWDKPCSALMILLLFEGMFENFLYLWPTAYIYWYIVGKGLKKYNCIKMKNDNMKMVNE